jgi:hypothetical protein
MMSTQADSLREMIESQTKVHGADDHIVKLLQQQLAEMEAEKSTEEPKEQTYFGRVAMKPKKAKKA